MEYKHGIGVDIKKEKWNNLIILDACRYDYFKEAIKKTKIKGILESRISRGTGTAEWLNANFYNDNENILYISASPQIDITLTQEQLPHLYQLWKSLWVNELNSVIPNLMIEKTLEILQDHKNYRNVIHFLQPHSPYVNGMGATQGYKNKIKFLIDNNIWLFPYPQKSNIKYEMSKSIIGYKQNLDYVLGDLILLTKKLKGITIISSDHGEAFGEKFENKYIYGHQDNTDMEQLKLIPWFKVKK